MILKIALLDLYEGAANQGMRCIREIVHQFADDNGIEIVLDEFDVRQGLEVPDLTYDAYISSGGPGSPLDSEGSDWENRYFDWLNSLVAWNAETYTLPKKPAFFICHSFQLACRYFGVATVSKRKSTSFGVFPIHMLPAASADPVLLGLHDPFYAVDSRDYQVVLPNHQQIRQMGGAILGIEKDRPHVPFERAIMGIRFNAELVGTQFHPEADAIGMSMHLQTPDRKALVIENHGEAKWASMIDHLNDPDKILFTHDKVLPNFLRQTVAQLHALAIT